MLALLTAQNVVLLAIFAVGFACGYAARHHVSCYRRERARAAFDYEQ